MRIVGIADRGAVRIGLIGVVDPEDPPPTARQLVVEHSVAIAVVANLTGGDVDIDRTANAQPTLYTDCLGLRIGLIDLTEPRVTTDLE